MSSQAEPIISILVPHVVRHCDGAVVYIYSTNGLHYSPGFMMSKTGHFFRFFASLIGDAKGWLAMGKFEPYSVALPYQEFDAIITTWAKRALRSSMQRNLACSLYRFVVSRMMQSVSGGIL